MEQSQAQRRLVKSPPELWAEVSSEDSLARRLSEFGEIRITRVEPETTVAWEGDRASGTVQLAPAGWGTKVVLTATLTDRTPPPEEPDARHEPAPPLAASAPRVPHPAPAPRPVQAARTQPPEQPPRDVIAVRTAPRCAPPTPGEEHRPGFFSRLFRRQHKPEAQQPAAPAGAPHHRQHPSHPAPPARRPLAAAPRQMHEPGPPAPGPAPTPPDPDPAPTPARSDAPASPPPAPPPAATAATAAPPPAATAAPPPAPALDPERTVAILTEVLDDLGAAHHRPFSRD